MYLPSLSERPSYCIVGASCCFRLSYREAPKGAALVGACLDVENLTVHLATTAPTATARLCGYDSGSEPDLRRFAEGIRRDEAAVHAAVTETWSNGPVEGHVNRLKTIKRQIYGRAGFVLLRARVLNPA